MKHIFYILSAVLFTSAFSVQADTTDYDAHFNRGDFVAVAEHVTQLHAGQVAGEVEADVLRQAFARFSETGPQIEPMIDAWLVAEPDSPYAHAAATWYYHGKAWRMRGAATYRYTWPVAIEQFEANLQLSQAHALAAFNADPNFVPATDALLMNDMIFDQLGPLGILKLTEAVMLSTPNRGTLTRAALAFRPNWGGDLSQVVQLCHDNADLVREVEGYTQEVCIADMVLSTGVDGDVRSRATSVLAGRGWDGFETYRYANYSSPIGDTETGLSHNDIETYLQQDGMFHYRLAQDLYSIQFNTLPRPEVDLRDEATQIIVRSKAHAREALENNPGNAGILRMALYRTESVEHSASDPDREARIAMWGEVLRHAPFNPEYWVELAVVQRRVHEGGFVEGVMTAFGNAIAYSNHKASYLSRALLDAPIAMHGRTFEDAETQATFDVEVLCPSIRLVRLFDAVCQSDPRAQSCNNSSFYTRGFTDAVATAAARNVCETERTAALQDIVFWPSATQVGAYVHDVE